MSELTPQKLFEACNEGRITAGELRLQLPQYITGENVDSLLETASSDVREVLESIARESPTSEEDWGKWDFIMSVCIPRWDEEQVRREYEEWRKRVKSDFRRGVETLRKALAR